MQRPIITLAALAVLAFPALCLSAGPADPLDQETLSRLTAVQLQGEFDLTIQQAREAQARYHNSRGRRLATGLVPVVNLFSAGATASRVGNLRAYQCKLLQLKRELRGRYPEAWEATKKKWLIDDHYLER